MKKIQLIVALLLLVTIIVISQKETIFPNEATHFPARRYCYSA